jgi:hypothetical protein
MKINQFFKNASLALATTAFIAVGCSSDDDNGGGGTTPGGESVEITEETTELGGKMHGTVKAGTYKLVDDLFIEKGREIVLEPGVRIESTARGSDFNESYSIFVEGSFFSLGTESNPVWITTVPENRKKSNFRKGYLGTIEGRLNCEKIVVKWTHLEFFGGLSGPGSSVYDEGETMYGFHTMNEQTELIIEDSWLRYFADDAIRPEGGKIAIFRNTFECIGGVEGEALNAKSGTVGDFAYNLMVGMATNGPKTGSGGGLPTQTIINVYNNTIVGGGFRRVAPGRGGSMNIENGAGGHWYNNIVVNCRYGMRVVAGTDYSRTFIDYTHYFGHGTFDNSEGPLSDNFYPQNGVIGTTVAFPANDNTDNIDPLFVSYDPTQFVQADYRNVHENTSWLPLELNFAGNHDFQLQSSSPCVGAGNTSDFSPKAPITEVGPRGLSQPVPGPNADLGAFPTDGSGNKHLVRNYYAD